jgi:hypothetical protein
VVKGGSCGGGKLPGGRQRKSCKGLPVRDPPPHPSSLGEDFIGSTVAPGHATPPSLPYDLYQNCISQNRLKLEKKKPVREGFGGGAPSSNCDQMDCATFDINGRVFETTFEWFFDHDLRKHQRVVTTKKKKKKSEMI